MKATRDRERLERTRVCERINWTNQKSKTEWIEFMWAATSGSRYQAWNSTEALDLSMINCHGGPPSVPSRWEIRVSRSASATPDCSSSASLQVNAKAENQITSPHLTHHQSKIQILGSAREDRAMIDWWSKRFKTFRNCFHSATSLMRACNAW